MIDYRFLLANVIIGGVDACTARTCPGGSLIALICQDRESVRLGKECQPRATVRGPRCVAVVRSRGRARVADFAFFALNSQFLGPDDPGPSLASLVGTQAHTNDETYMFEC